MCNFCDSQSCTGQCRNGWPFNRPFYNPPYSQPFARQCVPPVPPVPPWPCPTCNPCAPAGCLVSITTDCVLSTQNYNCIGTSSGTNLTSILNKINTIICNLSNCGTWFAFPLTPFANNGYQNGTIQLPLAQPASILGSFTSPPQYKIDNCGEVTLRGFVQSQTISFVNSIAEFTTLFDPNIAPASATPIGILPVGFRPKNLFVVPVFISGFNTNGNNWSTVNIKGWVFIGTDGSVFFGATKDTGTFDAGEIAYSFLLSLDNIKFSIN